MSALQYAMLIVFGLGSGLVIAGSTAAFIVMIGVVPRIADKTGTRKQLILYETILGLGGIIGSMLTFWEPSLKAPIFFAILIWGLAGMFTGCLAASLAEVLKVIPIFTRRAKVGNALFWFVIALAGGKCCGTLMFYLIPGFHD